MIFNFHIQEIFYILEIFHTLEIFHIMDFYMNFDMFLYQAFHILESFLIVSYVCTLSKLQYASLIGRRKNIYRQVYNIYAYVIR